MHMPHLPLDAIEQVAERFRVLGEPTRLRLLDAMRLGERSVGDLVEVMGTGQANVSKHLRLLHAAGLAGRRREGTTVYYHLADPSVFQLCDLVCGRLEATHERRRKALSRRKV
jgi:DNA-binding transcriptional ArsR family regulator